MPKKIVTRDGRIYVQEWTPGVDPIGMFCPKCLHKQEVDYYALLEHGATCEECGHHATKEDGDLRIYPLRQGKCDFCGGTGVFENNYGGSNTGGPVLEKCPKCGGKGKIVE